VTAHAIVSDYAATENANEILIWSSKDTTYDQGSSFKLAEVVRAVAVAEPALSNNCGDFVNPNLKQ
jgi:hypothetical protein